jgi:glucosylceramidase
MNDRNVLLGELFATTGDQSIGISYLRLSMGASDLNATVYTYNDLPAGQTDLALQQFSLSLDTVYLLPLLKEIVAINPAIKIMATPWTAPLWMKTNHNAVGGKLQTQYYSVYAQYFVRYLQKMKAEGITVDAVTPQNEPLHGGNNPSMEMTATEQADFIKNHLGPAFKSANLSTKIIIYDHNANKPDYPLSILNDPAAKAFVDGSAFHLYGGDINALSQVRNAHPDRNIYFTEQYTASTGNFGGDLAWHVRNLIVGATRNWSRNVLEWNLANDPSFGPHTPGGCTTCKGALTIGNGIQRNVSYYIIAHASRFVPAGSTRIESNVVSGLPNVAFQTPAGKKVLVVLNDTNSSQTFNIKYRDKWVATSQDAGSVATYVW